MGRKPFYFYVLVYIIFCINSAAFAQVFFHPPALASVQIAWHPPDTLADYSYQVRIFSRTGLNDSGIVSDTTTQVFFPKKYISDSLFAEVRTVRNNNAVSVPSVRIGFIPEVVQTDMAKDNRKRVDVADFEAFYKRFKRVLGRTLYKEVDK